MITGKIIDVINDSNGNIQVLTEYRDDKGTLIQTGSTRYSAGVNPDTADILTKIRADVDTHCKNLIARKYIATQNISKATDIKAVMVGEEKQVTEGVFTAAGKEYTVNETSVVSSKDVVIDTGVV